ncbi:MAG: hypothetical protein ACYDDF_05945 [Thermoplasmatota archaeon]
MKTISLFALGAFILIAAPSIEAGTGVPTVVNLIGKITWTSGNLKTGTIYNMCSNVTSDMEVTAPGTGLGTGFEQWAGPCGSDSQGSGSIGFNQPGYTFTEWWTCNAATNTAYGACYAPDHFVHETNGSWVDDVYEPDGSHYYTLVTPVGKLVIWSNDTEGDFFEFAGQGTFVSN